MILPEVSTLDIDVLDDLRHVGLCRLRVFCPDCAKETRITETECHGMHRSPLLLMLPTKRRLTLTEEISEYRTAIAMIGS